MEKKITKAMKYADTKAMLNGETPVNGLTVETACDFIDYEIELLSKKNAKTSPKNAAVQQLNDEYKDLILEVLNSATNGMTCTEIWKEIPAMSEYSPQKVASLMRGLMEEGKVTKTTVKGKALFALA